MELLTCNFCGCELDDDTAFYFGGSVMCEDCMDENTCFCNHCGERIWNDDKINEGINQLYPLRCDLVNTKC